MTVIRYGSRAAAALVMLGLWAGAPQALASVDDPQADQTASARAHGARDAAPHAGPSRGNRARNDAPAAPAKARVPAEAAAARSVPLRRNVSVAAAVAAPTDAPAAMVTRTDVPQVSAAAVAAASPVATAAPSPATIAVTNWFSESWSWLSGFDNPLSQALQGALVEVQRRLFSPAPTVMPVQYTAWTPGDPILGALEYVQPGGAAVSFELTQAPGAGVVQLLSDGTYTYTPGADFTGTDSFTAQVTAGGFNILEPFTPRTASVTVNINPGFLTQQTQGYDFINRLDKGVILREIQIEPGYEESVDSPPAGTIVGPGQTLHVELTRWLSYYYTTHFIFVRCVDTWCGGQTRGGDWNVGIARLYVTSGAWCDSGYCWDKDGVEIGPTNPGMETNKFVVQLADRPGVIEPF